MPGTLNHVASYPDTSYHDVQDRQAGSRSWKGVDCSADLAPEVFPRLPFCVSPLVGSEKPSWMLNGGTRGDEDLLSVGPMRFRRILLGQ